MDNNNFRQELLSPNGQLVVVGSPAEAGRLRSRGYRTQDELDDRAAADARAAAAVEPKAAEAPRGELAAPTGQPKPPRGAAAVVVDKPEA